MATVRSLLGIVCLVICGGFTEPSSDFLGVEIEVENKTEVEYVGFRDERLTVELVNRLKVNRKLRAPISQLQTQLFQLRTKILDIAQSQLGTREATGKNDGAAVEAYLNYTGNKKGTPWCASFISWVYGQAGLAQPRTAWSPALFPKNRQTLKPLPADVFGIYFPSLKRIAHCGIVEVSKGNWLQTIEGNTNADGLREGDGVYRKLRHKRTIALYANWINELKKGEPK